MAIAYISHYDCQMHDMGHHHPEQPARLSAINDRLIATGLEMILHQYDAPLATREQIEAVHDASYIAQFDIAETCLQHQPAAEPLNGNRPPVVVD